MFQGAIEGIENEVAGSGGGDDQVLPIVCEFDFGPLSAVGAEEALVQVGHVECGEGDLVIVANVVEQDSVAGLRGYGDDGGGGVVACEICTVQVEHALEVGRLQVPQAHGVVLCARDESVICGAELDGGDGVGVAAEVAGEGIVVGGEEADGVVDLCAGVDDVLGMVGEAGEVDTVLLALELLGVLAQGGVVYVQGLVVAGHDGQVARVVEVERGDAGALGGSLEFLRASARPGPVDEGATNLGWPKGGNDVGYLLRRMLWGRRRGCACARGHDARGRERESERARERERV